MDIEYVIAVCVLACIGIERSTEVSLQQMYLGVKRPVMVLMTALFSIAFCAPAEYASIRYGFIPMFIRVVRHNTDGLRSDPMMYIYILVLIASFAATGYSLVQIGRFAFNVKASRQAREIRLRAHMSS